VTWQDIAWLRRIWDGKLYIKGVLEPDDARDAVDVGDRTEILLDGGVRSGVDVLKAVALGARGVLIGRPWVWAVAGAGQQGLMELLETFQRELRTAMALTGVSRIADVGPELIDA
jgi:L-lactate dehydrogenase (cytochrome)